MRKVVKKIVLCLASCGIALTLFVTPTFALSQSEDDYKTFSDSVTEQNEFTSLNNKIKFYETRLKTRSANQNDLEVYAELCKAKKELINYLYELKELSVDDLQKYNCTADQIDAIQNYDGSDEMSSRAAATVTGTLTNSEYTYNSSVNKTYLTAKYTVKWNGKPYWKHDDVMCIGMVGSEANYLKSSSSFSCNKAGGNSNTNPRYDVHIGNGASVKFKIQDPTYFEVFSSATFTYRGVAGGKVTVSGIGATYLHWEMGVGDAGIEISASNTTIGFKYGPVWTQENKITRTCYL